MTRLKQSIDRLLVGHAPYASAANRHVGGFGPIHAHSMTNFGGFESILAPFTQQRLLM